ncbi:MAG: glycosyltransferase family 9 protein [bacterium]|nr:glycosyltransferase family 9 protein [bacterium]
MKFKKSKIPLTELIGNYKFISVIIENILGIIFLLFKLLNKKSAITTGQVVIISLNRIGDTIFTIPALREIVKTYSDKVIIYCFTESVPIYKLEFPNLKFSVVTHDEFRFSERIPKGSAKNKLIKLKPELIIDFTGSMVSALLILETLTKKVVGINRNYFRKVYDEFIPVRKEPDLIDIYYDAISPVLSASVRHKFNLDRINANPDGAILIHPYAGWKEKEWNFKKIISLASLINEEYEVNLIVKKNQLENDVKNEIDYHKIGIVITDSIDKLIEQIKECSLFIGNDSGPVNIANYLGKPTYSIYGSTNPDFTASTETYQIFSQKILNCSAQRNDKYCAIGADIYSCPGNECMNILSVEEVYNALQPLLNSYCSKK